MRKKEGVELKNWQWIVLFVLFFLVSVVGGLAEEELTQFTNSTHIISKTNYFNDSEYYGEITDISYCEGLICRYEITMTDYLADEQWFDYSTITMVSSYGDFSYQNSFTDLEDYDIIKTHPQPCWKEGAVDNGDGTCYTESKNVTKSYTKSQGGKYLISSKNHTRTFYGSFLAPFLGSSGKYNVTLKLPNNKTAVFDPFWISANVSTFTGTFNNTGINSLGQLALSSGKHLNESSTVFLARFDGNLKDEVSGNLPFYNRSLNFTLGRFDQGVNFNQTADLKYNISNYPNANGTVEFWLNPDTWIDPNTGLYNCTARSHWLFETSVGGNATSFRCSVSASNPIIFFEMTGASYSQININPNIAGFVLGWNHIAITWNGTPGQTTGTKRIFVNGVQRASETTARVMMASPKNFTIGNYDSLQQWTVGLNATIDDFRISNYAKTAAEIYNDFNLSYASNGTFLSNCIDFGIEANVTSISVNSTLSPGYSTANISWKNSNQADCSDGTFTAATPLNLSLNIYNISVWSRYFQYYPNFNSNFSNASHAIIRVSIESLRNLSQGIPLLNMTSGRNTTEDNLTAYNTSTYGLNVTNSYRWHLNGTLNTTYNVNTTTIQSANLSVGQLWYVCINATDAGEQVDTQCSVNITINSADNTAPNRTYLNQSTGISSNITYSGAIEAIRFNITDYEGSTITESRLILNNTANSNLYEINGSIESGGLTSKIYNYSFMMREIGIYQCKINATDSIGNTGNTSWFSCYNVTITPNNITPFTPTNANPHAETWIYAEINASSEIKEANITLTSNCSIDFIINNQTQFLGNITNKRVSWYVSQTIVKSCSFNASMNDIFNNSWHNDTKAINYKYITTAELKAVSVSGTIYRQGDKMSQFARCLDENNQLVNSTANITIWYPNMTTFYANNSGMTRIIDGLFNYSGTSPNLTGVYPFIVSCYAGSNSAAEGGDFQVAEWTQTINDINSTANSVSTTQGMYFPMWNTTFYYWNSTVFLGYNQNFSTIFNNFGIIQSNFSKTYDQFNCTKTNNSVCDYLKYLNMTLNNNSASFKAIIWNHPVFYVGNPLHVYFITQNQKGQAVEPQELNIIIYPSNETNITFQYNLSTVRNETTGVYFVNETITNNMTSGSYVISLNSTYNNITTYQKSTFRISKGAFDISINIPKKIVYKGETVNFTVTLKNNEQVTDDGLLTCTNGFGTPIIRSLLVEPGETKTFPLNESLYSLATDIQQNRENAVTCTWDYDAKPTATASEPYSERLSRKGKTITSITIGAVQEFKKAPPALQIGYVLLLIILLSSPFIFFIVYKKRKNHSQGATAKKHDSENMG